MIQYAQRRQTIIQTVQIDPFLPNFDPYESDFEFFKTFRDPSAR